MATITREQLAAEIAAAVNGSAPLADDAAARTWAKGGHVRVYLSRNHGGKKGWTDAGYVAITPEGAVDESNVNAFEFRYVKDDLRAALDAGIAGRTAEPVVVAPKVAAPSASKDEDVAQHEESQQALYASESARELG